MYALLSLFALLSQPACRLRFGEEAVPGVSEQGHKRRLQHFFAGASSKAQNQQQRLANGLWRAQVQARRRRREDGEGGGEDCVLLELCQLANGRRSGQPAVEETETKGHAQRAHGLARMLVLFLSVGWEG